jgi:hypothetical protein
MMKALEVKGVGLERETRSPVLLLKEVDGKGCVPLVIGEVEAMAILYALRGTVPRRPVAHDLMAAIVERFGGTLEEVDLTKMEEGICYACLRFKLPDGRTLELDARPSDSVALALRLSAPIYIEEELFEALAVELPES